MHAAVVTLQTAARQLQLSGELDRCEYDRMMAQLREVAHGLAAVERRANEQKAETIDFTAMLREAAALGSPEGKQGDGGDSGGGADVPDGMVIEGPAYDLRDALCSLVEYARTVGSSPVDLNARLERGRGAAHAICAVELSVRSPDVPDFLRRKLWDATRARHGEVCLVCEPERCRIHFKLPIARGPAPSRG